MSTKTKTVKKPASHPVYKDMVISVVKNSSRKGKSRIAIIKEIQENFSINSHLHDKHTIQCLKRLIDDGKLVKVKGLGLSGSFKLSKTCLETEVKKKRKSTSTSAKAPAAKKPTAAATPALPAVTAKKPAAPAKKPAAKKVTPKKPAPAKPKAKETPKKKPTPTKAAAKPSPKTKKPPAKKAKTPKKAAQKKK